MNTALTIKSVSALTGISSHTLRAWEKRYQAILPQRTPAGRRIYTLKDVERLNLIGSLIQEGHSIGGVVSLSKNELEMLLKKKRANRVLLSNTQTLPAMPANPTSSNGDAQKICQKVIEALRDFDISSIDRELGRARLHFNAVTVVLEVFSPLMAEVGRLVDEGKLGIGEEHTLSSLLRDQLGPILNSARHSNLSTKRAVLVTTPEGNIHEFGILLAAILSASHGFGVHYLGPNTPADEILRIARMTKPTAVILGSTKLPQDSSVVPLQKFVCHLKTRLPKSIELWVGGEVDLSTLKYLRRNTMRHLSSLHDLDQLLRGYVNKKGILNESAK